MSSSLASASFFFRGPAVRGLRLFNTVRPAASVRSVQASPLAAISHSARQPAVSDSAWTAEEQHFLRMLRESGL